MDYNLKNRENSFRKTENTYHRRWCPWALGVYRTDCYSHYLPQQRSKNHPHLK